jgi:hypothetical protein
MRLNPCDATIEILIEADRPPQEPSCQDLTGTSRVIPDHLPRRERHDLREGLKVRIRLPPAGSLVRTLTSSKRRVFGKAFCQCRHFETAADLATTNRPGGQSRILTFSFAPDGQRFRELRAASVDCRLITGPAIKR